MVDAAAAEGTSIDERDARFQGQSGLGRVDAGRAAPDDHEVIALHVGPS